MTNTSKIALLEARKANLLSRPKENKEIIKKLNRKITNLQKMK